VIYHEVHIAEKSPCIHYHEGVPVSLWYLGPGFFCEIAYYTQYFQDLNNTLPKVGLLIADLIPGTGRFDERGRRGGSYGVEG
jgi:hypothetical protein